MNTDKIEVTTQEDEAFDLIDTTSKQIESLANNSELPNGSEWENGLPPVGVECRFTNDNNLWGFASVDTYFGEVLKYEGEQFVFLLSHDKYNIRPCHLIVSRTDKGEFSKPETQEQRKERERLEAAYDLYIAGQESLGVNDYQSFQQFTSDKVQVRFWLGVAGTAGYRKDKA